MIYLWAIPILIAVIAVIWGIWESVKNSDKTPDE